MARNSVAKTGGVVDDDGRPDARAGTGRAGVLAGQVVRGAGTHRRLLFFIAFLIAWSFYTLYSTRFPKLAEVVMLAIAAGNLGGLWYAAIGWFLYQAAGASGQVRWPGSSLPATSPAG